jgi:hypothetical protein
VAGGGALESGGFGVGGEVATTGAEFGVGLGDVDEGSDRIHGRYNRAPKATTTAVQIPPPTTMSQVGTLLVDVSVRRRGRDDIPVLSRCGVTIVLTGAFAVSSLESGAVRSINVFD